ncbi:MAG TPA: c-type cytochrome [Myxococcota bacterium]|nr:c-type cytochrome [Myxococcota bacterium]
MTRSLESPKARYRAFTARLAGCALLLLACSRAEPPTPAARVQLAPELARTYQSVCAECHARPGTGAPLPGSAAWAARRAQGAPLLMEHVVNGYRGMPPLGACGACSEADLRALVAYLSGAGEPGP